MEDYLEEIIRAQTERELRDLEAFLKRTEIKDPFDEDENTEKPS